MKAPFEVEKLYKCLLNLTEDTYFVGGCVRDYLLNLPTKDYDLCINEDIAIVKNYLLEHDYHIYNLGEKFGTITVVLAFTEVEITSFRAETGYQDHRHPTVKRAYSLQEDIKRRDFTINALCYHLKKGIIDFYDGQKALKNKTIIAVGDPLDRFEEDALRILRAVRFAARLDFKIEEKTLNAMKVKAPLLLEISVERIATELEMILADPGAKHGLALLNETQVIKYILPNLDLSVFANKISDYIHIDERNSIFLYAINLLQIYFGQEEAAVKLYHQSNRIMRQMRNILNANKILDGGTSRYSLKKMLNYIDQEVVPTYLIYYSRFGQKDFNYRQIIDTIADILVKKEPYLMEHMAIDGFKLADFGLRNRSIGMMKEWLFEQILNNPQLNNLDSLRQLVKEKIKDR